MSKTAKKSSSKKSPAKKKAVKVKKTAPKKQAAKKAIKKIAKKSAPPKKKIAAKKSISKSAEKKSPVKKIILTKSSVKKALAQKKTRIAGGIIVKDLPAKKIEVQERPKSPLLAAIIEGLEEKKAKNITVIDLHKIQNRSFDHFVIADADSSTHVEAIAAAVEEEVKKKTGERPYHSEGWQNAEWILLDYVNVVVHVFQRSIREFYNIEGLWADAEIQKIN